MHKTPRPVSPLGWVPSLYFAMGLPFVVLNMVSAVMFKDLGIPDAQIAFWTSLIMWPWTIKFLWSPFLEIFRTKKFFVVSTQLVSGVMFGLAALALHLPSFFAVTVAIFAVIAFSGATHDIAADGVYMSELSQADQAKYIGWQGAFYNLAKLVATGGLVWFAGWLYERFDDGRMAAFDAFVQSWTVVLAILCVLLVLLGLYHARRLPSGGAAAGGHHTLREGMDGLREVIAAFFTKKHIGLYILFIILYRLGEGFVMKIVPLFLKADVSVGGLGLTNQQIGLYYGTFGAGAFLLGSLLAGYYIAARGLRRTLFTLVCIFNLPGLRSAGRFPAPVDVARRRRDRAGVFRLRLRVRRPDALHDAAGRPRKAPDGPLRLRIGHHEPLGDAHRCRVGLPERPVRLQTLLPAGDGRHRSGVRHDPFPPVHLPR